jgi:diaminopimelate epimerase
MKFYKLQALGNDFVFTNIENIGKLDVKKVCLRHFGVGADGVIFFEFKKDYMELRFFNSDGSEAKNCGNGLRCAAVLYKYLKDVEKGTIKTPSGENFFYFENDLVCINMGKPEYIKENSDHFEVSVGNLHKIFMKNAIIESEICNIADNNREYNIEFIVKQEDGYRVKVYERGVGFTLGCGTGATAVFSVLNKYSDISELKLFFDGGELRLKLNEKGDIILMGEAKLLFEAFFVGEWYFDK